jgi:hypothetical protein
MINISEEVADIKTQDIYTLSLNNEINEIIEKAWLNSTATTKEQKDKQLFDIFHTFLNQLNKNLKEDNAFAITDLILEKSILIAESTGIYDWPSAEVLKISNLHRLTLFLYNYSKFRLNLIVTRKSGKHIKDLYLRAFENSCRFLEVYLEISSTLYLQADLVFIIFKDLFEFYVLARENASKESQDKIKDDVELLIDNYKEETSN